MHDRESYHKIEPEDIAQMVGAYRASSVDTQDGQVQLGIQWTRDRGWSIYIAPTLIGCMTKVWNQEVMLLSLKTRLDN